MSQVLGIIGSGAIGSTLARLAIAAGLEVIIGNSRGPETLTELVAELGDRARAATVEDLARDADIVVAAVGRPRMICGDQLKPGVTVIDVGINRVDVPAGEGCEGKSRLVGDVAFAEAAAVAGAITPVPGGVGPMTIANLLANTLHAAHARAGLDTPEF